MTSFRAIRGLLILALILSLSGCALFNKEEASPSQPLLDASQAPALLLDDNPFKPEPAPVMLDGKLYMPFIESLALLNIATETYPKHDTVVAYHDNRFLKINTEKLTLSRNGKTLPKSQAPVLIKDTLYVPASLIFDSFNFGVTYPKDGVVSISYQENQDSPQLVDGEYYVPITAKESDLQFSVPKSWSRMPGSPYRFGEKSNFDDYNVTFLTLPIEQHSDSELLLQLADKAATEAGVELIRNQVSPLQVNGLDGIAATYQYYKNDASGQMTLYLFKRDKTAYVFQGWVHRAMDETTALRQITGIARSLRFGDMAVDVQREYYMEADTFFEKGVELSSPLYSNMEVRGQFQLSGTLADRGVKWLYVATTRGGETLTQQIPVKDKAFSAAVYTPLGLGKHDLTLYASKDEQKPQDRILQVSVVNTDPQETRWMIPSALINSENDYITSQSSLLTYKTYGDYMKARELFSWIVDNIALKPSTNQPLQASEIYLQSAGNEQEIAILYTALLRATEIPARVVTATDHPEITWVEMQMNGQWVESDPVAAIQRIKDGAPLKEALDAHFNMSMSYFEEKYPAIDTMPW